MKHNGEIVKGDFDGKEVIGYVDAPDHFLKTSIFPIKVYDIHKNLITKGTSKILTDEEFTTFDGKEHKYKIERELNELFKFPFLTDLVYRLILSGYIYEGAPHPFDASKNVLK